ncbi:MAG: 50S ribosomal protein L29 [Patescibacteria group bacterium]|nr:50S ribosomal protein L29 [Patescibacteria group bacterium]
MAQKTSYNGRSKEELLKTANDKREELRVLRFGSAGSKNKNVKAVRTLRKDIARVLTAMNAQK